MPVNFADQKQVDELKAQINALASNAAISLETLVKQLNQLIMDNNLSDKQIGYTKQESQLATWNMGCGDKWVNSKAYEGTPSSGGVINPTYDKPKEHNGRMQCCAAIVNALKVKGIDAITLQEAPPPNDSFYRITNGVKANKATKSSHQGLAMFSKASANHQYANAINALARSCNIPETNYQLSTLPDGRPVVNVHFDFNPPSVQDKNNFMNKLSNDFGAVIAGDTNMPKLNVTNNQKMTFGVNGAVAVDAIISNKITQPGHQLAKTMRETLPQNLNPNAVPPSITPPTITIPPLSVNRARSGITAYKSKRNEPYIATTPAFPKSHLQTSTSPAASLSAETQLAKEIKMKDSQHLNADTDMVLGRGQLNNTFKLAFKNYDEARQFFDSLQANNLGIPKEAITFFGKNEKYPMGADGKPSENGEYKFIVRFRIPENALTYLKDIKVDNAESLFNKVMDKGMEAKSSYRP